MYQRISIDIPVDLRVCLKGLHRFAKIPDKQSIRDGTQISLLKTNNKIIRSFVQKLKTSLASLIKEKWVFSGLWSICMNQGGHHVMHNHPKGWLSGVCYVSVPDKTSGHFLIGSNLESIIPNEGDILLFPSNVSHGTTVYNGHQRITIAFDIVKDEKTIPLVG